MGRGERVFNLPFATTECNRLLAIRLLVVDYDDMNAAGRLELPIPRLRKELNSIFPDAVSPCRQRRDGSLERPIQSGRLGRPNSYTLRASQRGLRTRE